MYYLLLTDSIMSKTHFFKFAWLTTSGHWNCYILSVHKFNVTFYCQTATADDKEFRCFKVNLVIYENGWW